MAQEFIRIRLRGKSAYLIKGKGSVLVDTGGRFNTNRILKNLKKYNVDKLDLIVITHGHIHSFANARTLREKTGAYIAIHKEDEYAITQGRNVHCCGIGFWAKCCAFFVNLTSRIYRVKGIEPDIVIQNNMSLKSYGVEASIITTPGHTAGSVCVVSDDGQIITGGMFTKRPFSKTPIHAKLAENPNAMAMSINRVILMQPKQIDTPKGAVYIQNGSLKVKDTIAK